MARPSLILVGHFATGKTSVARQLARATHLPVVDIGDIVRDRAFRSGSSSVFEHAASVIVKGDRLTFVREALERAKLLGAEPFIIVGVRTVEELAYLRANLDQTLTIALVADDAVRRARWMRRPRQPELGWDARDATERSWGLDDVVSSADKVVDSRPDLAIVVDEVETLWSLAT